LALEIIEPEIFIRGAHSHVSSQYHNTNPSELTFNIYILITYKKIMID
jgi:hypothetical protein